MAQIDLVQRATQPGTEDGHSAGGCPHRTNFCLLAFQNKQAGKRSLLVSLLLCFCCQDSEQPKGHLRAVRCFWAALDLMRDGQDPGQWSLSPANLSLAPLPESTRGVLGCERARKGELSEKGWLREQWVYCERTQLPRDVSMAPTNVNGHIVWEALGPASPLWWKDSGWEGALLSGHWQTSPGTMLWGGRHGMGANPPPFLLCRQG